MSFAAFKTGKTIAAAFAFFAATFRGAGLEDDGFDGDGLDLEFLPLRVGVVADLFFFLPAMRENILSHARFPARCGPILGTQNLKANLVPLIHTAFQQFSEKECGKRLKQLSNVAEPACFYSLHKFRCLRCNSRLKVPAECRMQSPMGYATVALRPPLNSKKQRTVSPNTMALDESTHRQASGGARTASFARESSSHGAFRPCTGE
ncbi:MAG TPA: hypothetical protein VKV30_05820 [Candidatus Angelobacter sp.]|nr:hypothetical protein [Candidatus Angelobacter sp.]